jgi:hypothetical protein
MSITIPGIVKNGVVVLNSPLPEGVHVDVTVLLPEQPAPARRPMLEFLKFLPPGPLLFDTPEEANRYIQEERDSWER